VIASCLLEPDIDIGESAK